jgi:hypothetical protein
LEEVCKSALELEHSRPTLYTLEVPVEEFKKKKQAKLQWNSLSWPLLCLGWSGIEFHVPSKPENICFKWVHRSYKFRSSARGEHLEKVQASETFACLMTLDHGDMTNTGIVFYLDYHFHLFFNLLSF